MSSAFLFDHPDDHSLQQFVNNLANQPVRFHYEAFGFEGRQVGIISIDEQTRPIYLKRDYGKLLKEKVYIRRGSSTDPSQPASLDEIARMRIGSAQPAAELLVEFSHVERDNSLGTAMSWDAEFCEMPAMETIPNLLRPPLAIGVAFDPMNHPNEDFFRELATFERVRRLFRPIRLAVKNVGQVAAHNVRVELTVPTNIGVAVLVASKLPAGPRRRADPFSNPVLAGIRSRSRAAPGEVRIDNSDEQFRIEIDCADLQPGRRMRSDIFYIGKKTSGDLSLSGLVFADNLPQPKNFLLTVSVMVTRTAMTLDELRSLP